jgi:hypothetical protein
VPSLIKRSNGIYYGVFSQSGKRVWRSTRSSKIIEAREIYASIQSEFKSWDKLTVITFRDTLLDLVEGQIAHSTAALYRQVLTKLSTIIGDMRLGRIQAYHIELFKSKRLKEVSATKVNIDYSVMFDRFGTTHTAC